jgi:hypothetical protein
VAVDPIDGTTLASKNLDNALSIIDGAERGQHVIVRRNSDASDRPHTGIVEVTREMLEQCHAGQLGCEADGVVFVESFPAAARLIVSGATDFARALVAVGRLLDFAPQCAMRVRSLLPLRDFPRRTTWSSTYPIVISLRQRSTSARRCAC